MAILTKFCQRVIQLLRLYPHLELNRSSAKFVKIAILAEFAGFVKIAASSVPPSRAQSLFGEITSKSSFSPNSPDSSKSPLSRYPYLELNRSSAKFSQNCHSRRIRWIRQNRRFVSTPILSSIDLWQNFVKIAILVEFAGFIKIAASSVPPSRAQSLFGEITSKSPFSPNSLDLSKLPHRRYPHLELNRSLVKFVKIAILAKFVKIAASSVPLS